MDKKEQQAIVDEFICRLLETIEADISELENNEKYRKVAASLNSQPIAKRYLDFSIAYCWVIDINLGMQHNVSEKNSVCEAVFEGVYSFVERYASHRLDLAEYIKEGEETRYLSSQFAKDKITEISITLLWKSLLEKRFFDYNSVYSGAGKFFPVANRFYAHIFGEAPSNDFDSSVLTSLFAGFLSKVFTIRIGDQWQQEIIKYTKMIYINPGYAKAYYNRAVAYYNRKEFNKSWQDICKAKELGCEVEEEFVEKLKEVLGKA